MILATVEGGGSMGRIVRALRGLIAGLARGFRGGAAEVEAEKRLHGVGDWIINSICRRGVVP